MTTRKKTAKPPKKTPVLTEKRSVSAVSPQKPTENNSFHYSITALSKKFVLDRATVRDRLDEAGIQPVSVKAKEKLYHLDDVEIVLSQSEMNEAKLRKIEAEAELKELELKIKSGDYASVAEFTEIVQRIFGRLHKKLAVQLPGRVANRLHNANSSADVAALLKTEITKEFNDLRNDFTKYL